MQDNDTTSQLHALGPLAPPHLGHKVKDDWVLCKQITEVCFPRSEMSLKYLNPGPQAY